MVCVCGRYRSRKNYVGLEVAGSVPQNEKVVLYYGKEPAMCGYTGTSTQQYELELDSCSSINIKDTASGVVSAERVCVDGSPLCIRSRTNQARQAVCAECATAPWQFVVQSPDLVVMACVRVCVGVCVGV